MPIKWSELFDTSKLNDTEVIAELRYGEALGIEQEFEPTAKGVIEHELKVLEKSGVGQALFQYMKDNNIKLEIKRGYGGSNYHEGVVKIDFSESLKLNFPLVLTIAHESAHSINAENKKSSQLIDRAIASLKKDIDNSEPQKKIDEFIAKEVQPIKDKIKKLRENHSKAFDYIAENVIDALYANKGSAEPKKTDRIILEAISGIKDSMLNNEDMRDHLTKLYLQINDIDETTLSSYLLKASENILSREKHIDPSDKIKELNEDASTKENNFKSEIIAQEPDYAKSLKEYNNLNSQKKYLHLQSKEEYSMDIEMMLEEELGLHSYTRNHYGDKGFLSKTKHKFIPTSANFSILTGNGRSIDAPKLSNESKAWSLAFDEVKIDIPENSKILDDLVTSGVVEASQSPEKTINRDELLKYSYNLISESVEDKELDASEYNKIKELGDILEKAGIDFDMNLSRKKKDNQISVSGYYQTTEKFKADKDIFKG